MSDQPCGAYPAAPAFIFGTVVEQRAANAVYLGMSTMNGLQVTNGSTVVKRFKTDRERMQYVTGGFARNTNCCNAGNRCSQ